MPTTGATASAHDESSRTNTARAAPTALHELQTAPTFHSIDDMLVDEDVDKFSDEDAGMLLNGEE